MKLLKELYCINSKSNKEQKMAAFLESWVKTNVPEAVLKSDRVGNMYITKGESETYPVVVAHMDQVQNYTEPIEIIQEIDDFIIGFSRSAKRSAGLGADDKNGIWVALQCLLQFDAIKVAFFVGEEIGCVGSRIAHLDFFEDARFVIQCDRKGGSDFITVASGTSLCSKQFVDEACLKDFGYTTASGLMTDVKALKDRGLKVSCCNISCGYYNPHSDNEVTVVSELMNCLKLVTFMITNMQGVYKHRPSTQRELPFFGAGLGSEIDNRPYTKSSTRPSLPRVTPPNYLVEKQKEYEEQLRSAEKALVSYLTDNEVVNPYVFYNENHNLFPRIKYHQIVSMYHRLIRQNS